MADDNTRSRLGRGLAALIGEMDRPEAATKAPLPADNSVAIELISANPNNPRSLFSDDDMADLANSIRRHGIVQPILVRPIAANNMAGSLQKYEIIAGERRWRAAQMAEMHNVPVIIRQVDDKQALEIAIVENVQRTDLNPIEEAYGYQQLVEEHQYTQSDLASVIGKSRSHVANILRLLKLPKNVRSMVSAGALSAGHARALVTADNPEKLANKIVKEGLSVRQVETLMQASGDPSKNSGKKTPKRTKDADTLALERSLSDLMGLNVSITFKKDNTGDIRIAYSSLEQLDDICRRLQQ